MKIRFLALLGAMAVASASILVYATQSRPDQAAMDAAGDCSSCEMMSAAMPAKATVAVNASDECCATEAAKPTVATLATAGCPYVPADVAANVALLADTTVPAASASADACCAVEGAATMPAPVAADVE